ncbi:hypothetical protein ACTFIV_003224, partial [Dictyostelium citrinum]
QVQIW